MKLQLTKQINGFFPTYESDYELCKSIKIGETIEVEYKKQRNIAFHSKFFALINLAFDNQGVFTDREKFRKALLYEASITEETPCLTGELRIEIKSLRFDKMDELEFAEVYKSVYSVVMDYIGVTNKDLEENLLRYF